MIYFVWNYSKGGKITGELGVLIGLIKLYFLISDDYKEN